MIGRVEYPVTRDVVLLTDDLWLDRPSISCYMRASTSGVFETLTASQSAYISSALKLQNNLSSYINSYEGTQQPSLACFISSPMLSSSLACYLDSYPIFKGHNKQFCFITAASNLFPAQLMYVRGRQDLSLSLNCHVASNSIIQFVQHCYLA